MTNFVLPAGTLSFTPEGGSAIAIGETPDLTLTVKMEKAQIWTSDGPIAELGASVVTKVERSGSFTTNDIAPAMLALFVVGTNTTGTITTDDDAVLSGALTFTGDYTHGTSMVWTFHKIELEPEGDLVLKSRDKYQQLAFKFAIVKPASGPLITIAPAT